MIYSPTCFGHLQEDVFDTRIQVQLNVSQSLHNTKKLYSLVKILLLDNVII